MSAWVIALGLSAGYLMNKNSQITTKLEAAAKEFNSAAKPDVNNPSEEIRQVQRTIPDSERYQDLNMQDLTRTDVKQILKTRDSAHEQVAAYEASTYPIEGVYLNFDNHGV